MTKEKIRHRSLRAAFGAVLALILLSPAAAFCDDQVWTTVASAGTVDERDLGRVSFNGPLATVKSAAPSSVVIRYNVVALDDLSDDDDCLRMSVRFRDNGAASRVVVRLKRFSLSSGTTSTLLTMDSDRYNSNVGFQTRTVGRCASTLDFEANAYFIEAELTRSAAAGTPALAAIKIYSTDD
ncbi:MAG TPA: hypothetical protein PK250_05800 [Syntrophobacter fumaroxidans]|nr:hypothetical protein [Syntrophobacter fumaroxidans]